MSPSLSEQIGVESVGHGEFISQTLPMRMANARPVAYGGCSLSVAVSAACATTKPSLDLYSIVGHFHGPASPNEKLLCTVKNTRGTRSFSTRRVRVHQKQPDGTSRTCLDVLVDFHTREPSSLDYSANPVMAWPKPENCPTGFDNLSSLQGRGAASDDELKEYRQILRQHEKFIETRICPNGVSGQNLSGVASKVPTTQDYLPVTLKRSAEWSRSRSPLRTSNENLAAVAFLMDGTCSFVPLTHDHMWFQDVTACSSIDVALRFFTKEVNFETWHIVERNAIRAGGNRTFAESRIWDGKGNLIAHMSQQSIMRLKKDVTQSNL
ncbi:hypothetical protein GQ607_008818 [Colletotrichum asianum]|uniref:Thioesterase-like superfamily-domain-containing protein n=1 Tax=Colletotrichum asianum TaxID=702518 RepID=A0A8H3ZRT2_9PEZI|nr:hypothetical protein GQ607_008818 [Colletotrichum asianum]